MANTNLGYEGDWIVEGYAVTSGIRSPLSGTCKGTVDGDVVTIEYDMTMHINGNDVPFPVTTTISNFDEESQGFEVMQHTTFGNYEGAGKVFPEFNIGWLTESNLGATNHTITEFLGENEIKQITSTFDDTGKYSGVTFMHYSRA